MLDFSHLNYAIILLATFAQFIIGAIWYTPLFGGLWRKIHGMDKMSKEDQKEAMKTMGPYLGIQFVITFVTTVILALFISYLPTWNAYVMAGLFWVGFVVPTQVSAVIFGGTEGKWVLTKIAISAGGSILCLEAAVGILHFFA